MDTLISVYDKKIRPLMDKIDQARSLLSFNSDGIKFPNVVVVGDQSSGKSTLLEALSLVELPKGTGIVTRCPLVLRLRKSNQRRVYHLHNNTKTPLNEAILNILQYIESETNKLAGGKKNVVHDLIELQVEDPNVRDLTLVDLPGIAPNPISDQPKDIHKQTTDLIRNYIQQEGSVILCVFPANVDVATVESFTLAKEVDPSGVRTIGVITKSDLAPNQNVFIQQLSMDQSHVFHLKLGFIAVRNRSTDEKLSLSDARIREKEFFHEHPASTTVGWNCLGVDALINRLAELYSDRVRDTFPKMREEVQAKLKEVNEQLSKLPPDLETPQARLAKYYELVDFYVENILRMRLESSNDDRHPSMVNSLHEKFKQLEKTAGIQKRQFFSDSYRLKVRGAMSACFGEQLPNFLPYPVFKRLIHEKLDQLREAIEILINDCFRMTQSVLSEKDEETCNNDILMLKLLPTFRHLLISYLNEKSQTVHSQLQELIRLEKHDPYTINHYYMDTTTRLRSNIKGNNKAGFTSFFPITTNNGDDDDNKLFLDAISNDDQAVQEMMISLYAYWNLLLKRLIDYTALFVRAECVFDICAGMRERLRQIPIQQTDFIDACLAEDTQDRNRRKQLQQSKERLGKVHGILGDSTIATHDTNIIRNATTIEASTLMTLEKYTENLHRFTKKRPLDG